MTETPFWPCVIVAALITAGCLLFFVYSIVKEIRRL